MTERRALLRYPAQPNSLCLVDQPFTRLHLRAEVRDISRGGAGLVLSMELPAGLVVELELTGSPPLRKQATLRHTQEIHEDQWFAGFAFAEELTPEELRALRGS